VLAAVGICGAVLVACSEASPDAAVTEAPARPSSEPRASEAGLYLVSLRPETEPAPLRRLHSWIARIESPDGDPVRVTRLAVSGGMPAHEHGFETRPRVTRGIAQGEYLIEGVRFHMTGHWVFRLEWVGPAGADVALVDVQVRP
jgi:hypothetical protein